MDAAWTRFRGRIRFGLATQEVLDRIARVGLVVYPYYLVEEPVVSRPVFEGMQGLETRRLQPDDAALIGSLPERPRDASAIRALLAKAGCIAILENGELLGYSWFRRDILGGGFVIDRIVALPDDCAYLFDMFVCRRARGRNVAAILRNEVHRTLAGQGVRHAFSVSLAFNRSTRRFKSKLGAVEVELRVLLRVKPFPGLDLRLHRRPWRLSIPAVRVIRPPQPANA